jgi:thiol-disulfide isomerase/thioredoxin
MKLIRAFILFMALAQSGWVFAAGQPFTKSQFDNLMKEGKPIIVHVHAPWCSNCKAQNSVLNVEMKSPAYKGVTFLEVDFDTQNEAVKAGMTVSAVIITDSKDGVLAVPNSAVKTQGKITYVEIADSSSKTGIRQQIVKVGLSNETFTVFP